MDLRTSLIMSVAVIFMALVTSCLGRYFSYHKKFKPDILLLYQGGALFRGLSVIIIYFKDLIVINVTQ